MRRRRSFCECDSGAVRRNQSQQFDEVVGRDFGLTQNGAQRAAIQLAVIGNHRLSEWAVAPQDDVTAVLPPDGETDFLEGADDVRTGNLWKLAHTARRSASKCSSGTGRPSSRRVRM